MQNGHRKPVDGRFSVLGNGTVGFILGSYDHAKPLIIDPVLAYSTYLGGSYQDYGYAIAVDSSANTYVTGSACSNNFPVTTGALQSVNNHYDATEPGDGECSAFLTKFNATGTALLYSTYIGGSGITDYDSGQAIAVDTSGNAYITGYTTSLDFPVTANAFQTINSGNSGAFVTKLNPSGSALLYSTYLGAESTPCLTVNGSLAGDAYFGASASGIAVDGSGNAYVTGDAYANFPVTTGAFQTVTNASQTGCIPNAFITKLNATGSALIYSTYLGGSGYYIPGDGEDGSLPGDYGAGIVVDGAGDAYVTGTTWSSNFPVTPGAAQTQHPSNQYSNAFVAKLNPTGTGLIYSSYIGGNTGRAVYRGDNGQSLALDSEGDVYITGLAESTDFPVTAGAFQRVNKASTGGTAFVAKLNTSGSALQYATYLGGSGSDGGYGIGVDGSGDAYVTGFSTSTDYPVTLDALQPNNNATKYPTSYSNAVISVVNPSGSALLYSTYLGGNAGFQSGNGLPAEGPVCDTGYGIALDGSGNVYVAGTTCSVNYPVTAGVVQPEDVASYFALNAFVSKLALAGVGSQAATSISLTASTTNVVFPRSVTLSAQVSVAGNGSPTGTVLFTCGAVVVGTEALDSDGVASITLQPGPGSYVVTAIYSGAVTQTMSMSSPVTLQVVFAQAVAPNIYTYAGNGIAGFNGDGILAGSGELNSPTGIAVDANGNVYIADYDNNRVRMVSADTGYISTVAGSGEAGYSGDGSSATSADLSQPCSVATDAEGNIYIADRGNNRIRKVTASNGIITTIAGNGSGDGYNGDGIPATAAELDTPQGVAVDGQGNIYIADTSNSRIREVASETGIISTVAGMAGYGYNGDGIQATSALLQNPTGVTVDADGNLFIADFENARVRKVTKATGIISTIAGNGTGGYGGDGGLATSAELAGPYDVFVDGLGDVFIADAGNNRIREVVAATSVISTVAGDGQSGYSGDGGPATSAGLSRPDGVMLDSRGNLYIADTQNQRIRVVGNQDSGGMTVATPTVTVTPSSSSITTAQSLSVSVTVSGGTGNPTPTGSVILTSGSYGSTATSLSGGSATINVPAGSLAIGTETLTVNYTPDSNSSSSYNSAAGTASVTITAPSETTPTLTVTPSSSSITTAQALSVAVVVSGGSGSPAPTGSVTLTSGSYISAATTLSGGSATISIPAGSLAIGADTLTVNYIPDSNSSSIYNGAAGAASVSVTTAAPASYSLSDTPVTVNPGSSGTSTVTITGADGYAGTVSLACSVTNSPAGATDLPTCSSSQTVTLSPSTTAGTATVTIATTAPSTSALILKRDGWTGLIGGGILALLILPWGSGRIRKGKTLLQMLVLIIVLRGLGGCGGGGGSSSSGGSGTQPTNPGTTAGSYTITVTGTGNDAAHTTASATFTLTVN